MFVEHPVAVTAPCFRPRARVGARVIISLVALAAVRGARPAVADQDAEAAAPTSVRIATAARRTGDLALDGTLDDAAWTAAPVHGDFVQRSPDEGAAPSHATTFRVLYDERAIYVGVRCDDAEPDKIRGLLTRRDEDSPSDTVFVALDSYHDRRTAYLFGLNAAGVQRDVLVFDDVQEDASWDAVWTGASARTSTGWSAEFRIPLGQLRFAASDDATWGLQVSRFVARSNEQSVWSPSPRAGGRYVANFGELRGLAGVSPGRRLELLPYITGGIDVAADERGSAFRGVMAPRWGVGLDVKYGLGSSLTLAASLNPDFGQIEADPSQVNLTANETFFSERRPFFLDGIELFQARLAVGDGNAESLFYSRRIGAPPRRRLAFEAAEVDEPSSTTIYGAAKLSGKTAGGWSVGVLDAVTAEESGRFVAPGSPDPGEDPTIARAVLEPLSNYAVAKVGKDLRGGRTSLALVATSVERRLDGTQLSGWMHDRALAAGALLQHRFAEDRWLLSASAFGSHVEGSAEAIAATQLLPRHLYQRPDAPHLEFDPSATSMRGLATAWQLDRQGGAGPLYGGVGGEIRTPGFEVNDLGYQQGADSIVHFAYLSMRDNQPGKLALQYQLNANAWVYTDFAPWFAGTGGNLNGNLILRNFWSASGGVEVEKNRWDFVALRGGPALRASQVVSTWGNLSSNAAKPVVLSLGVTRAADDSWQVSGELGLAWQARSNVALSLGAGLEERRDELQYVATAVDDLGAPHYLLGRIHQRTATLTLRGAWTFTPRLGLQLYAQPFASSGGYDQFKDVVDADAQAAADRYHVLGQGEVTEVDGAYVVSPVGGRPYAFGRPDFSFRELSASLVLRWEYRPGSTIFAIWSHGRSSFDGDGALRVGDALDGLAAEPGRHVVMIKANYWLGL
jgi:hypothetical protein